jgi:hypothetical protein
MSRGTVYVVLAAASAACTTASVNTAASPEVFALDVPATFDSTVNLARFALQAIDGSLQMPRVRPRTTSVSTHYTTPRRGGGHTQVAIIAAVNRSTSDSSRTIVEVSAWLLDVAHQLTPAQRRAGIPATAITTNAPVLNRPRLVTPADTAHYKSLEYVLESFVQHGARFLPKP